ncbi:GNAT family acetyltransferase [Fusobacterium sp.]|uniref:GNAT family acetyltransferase n=1 Tax=Fusobacterium sp. TaxID=68766 RepID=UPI002637E0BF|nr:GNAT family acetyltransferase [Fusobacterium sp.]
MENFFNFKEKSLYEFITNLKKDDIQELIKNSKNDDEIKFYYKLQELILRTKQEEIIK